MTSSSDGTPPPTKRLNSTTGIDRISSLPESLIIHILSFLRIRDRIKTGVLSRSWRYLWACVPNLVFTYSCAIPYYYRGRDAPNSEAEFVNLVDKTLILRNGARVESFKVISFPYTDVYASNIDLWAHFAARNCTHKFELCFTLSISDTEDRLVGHYRLPQFLFTNTSVRELWFDGCMVNPSVTVTWNSLKRLTFFDSTRVNEDDLQKILAGTPVLESLELVHLEGLKSLNLGTSSVKELQVHCIEDEFELSAPNLQSLKIWGFFSGYCKLSDLTSLAEASLEAVHWNNKQGRVDFVSFARGLLDNILHVESLTLGEVGIQAIAEVYPNGALSTCKNLTIDTHQWVTKPLLITSLLESCPHLEMLIITMSATSKLRYTLATPIQLDEGDAFWKSHKSDFSGLKLVKIIKFIDFWDYRAFTFSLTEFLLEKASTLKKLVVNMETKHSGQIFTADERSKAAQKLFKMPRSSPDVELVVF